MNPDTLRCMFEGVDPRWTEMIAGGDRKPLLSKAIQDVTASVGGDTTLLAPEPCDIFRAFRMCPWDGFRVLIIGQDPYPVKGDADGLAFSSRAPSHPKSLKMIFDCLKTQQLVESVPATSRLDSWAAQGVLLLNATLTTRVGVSRTHAKMWDKYTDALVKRILEVHSHSCVLMWGKDAQSKGSVVEHPHSYTWGHPSPVNTANRKRDNPSGFLNCDNFRKCNEDLVSRGLAPIRWNSVCDDARPKIIIGTDGGSRGNGKPDCRASWAYCMYRDDRVVSTRSGLVDSTPDSPATNNRGELMAILRAVESLEDVVNHDIMIVSDSEYCINTLTEWAPKWFADPAKLEGKKNIDIVRSAVDRITALRAGNTVTFQHVNSHRVAPAAGTPEHTLWLVNDTCDKLCQDALV